MKEWLYGKIPVKEALLAGRRPVYRVSVSRSAHPDRTVEAILALAGDKGVPCREVPREFFQGKIEGGPVQGVGAEVGPFPLTPFKNWIPALEAEERGVLLALDQVQDPQNLGAILRASEAAGSLGLILPDRHSPPLSPTVSKASAGALEHQKVARVKNLVQSLRQLKAAGYWVVGTEAGARENALEFDWPQKMVLVLGSEGSGMRRLTGELCDFLISLPLLGKIASLNVAQTAAVCLYLNLASRLRGP